MEMCVRGSRKEKRIGVLGQQQEAWRTRLMAEARVVQADGGLKRLEYSLDACERRRGAVAVFCHLFINHILAG